MRKYIDCDKYSSNFIDADMLEKEIGLADFCDEEDRWLIEEIVNDICKIKAESYGNCWILTEKYFPHNSRPVLVAYKSVISDNINMAIESYKYDRSYHRKKWTGIPGLDGYKVLAWMELPKTTELIKKPALSGEGHWANEEKMGDVWKRLILIDD